MSALFEAELEEDLVRPIWFVEALFDSGALRLWSGRGDLSWNGETWLGASALSVIGGMTESSDMKTKGTDIVLTGLDPAIIAIALAEPVKYRTGRVYFGFLDADMALITDPIPMIVGDMQFFTIKRTDETATVSLKLESKMIRSQVPRERRYTPWDQNRVYPTDKGFDFVSIIQDRKTQWKD